MNATHVLGDDLSSLRIDVKERTSPFLIETTSDVEAVAPAWRDLETAGSAFQSRKWLALWYKLLAPTVRGKPVFVTVRDRATERPLVLFQFFMRWRWCVKVVEFPDLGVTDYNAPICAEGLVLTDEQVNAIWAEVRLAVPGADLFLFEKMPDALYGKSVPFARLGWLCPMDLCSWTVELPADRDHYENSILRTKDRKEQRRKRRNLVERLGELKLVEADTRARAIEFFATLKKMRAERFRRQGRRDILTEAQFAPFYQALAQEVRPDFISLITVLADDTPIAVLMALRHSNNYVLIMHSFASDIEQLSPGIVALDELMTHLIRAKIYYCDFTTGNEPYKKQFGVKECSMLHGFDPVTLQGQLFGALLRAKNNIRAKLIQKFGKYLIILRRLSSTSLK